MKYIWKQKQMDDAKLLVVVVCSFLAPIIFLAIVNIIITQCCENSVELGMTTRI